MKSEQELLAEIQQLRLDKAFLEGRIFELERRVSPPPFKIDWPPITPFIPTTWPKDIGDISPFQTVTTCGWPMWTYNQPSGTAGSVAKQ